MLAWRGCNLQDLQGTSTLAPVNGRKGLVVQFSGTLAERKTIKGYQSKRIYLSRLILPSVRSSNLLLYAAAGKL